MSQDLVVVGLGYVGLPLAEEGVRSGLAVKGLDLQKNVVDGLNAGRSHVDDLSDDTIAEMLASGFAATTDESILAEADAIVVCVPTPLSAAGGPDLRAVEGAMRAIARHLKKGQLVVLESTTYPGTTEEVALPILEESGLVAGEDFDLAFSPERIDPGNSKYQLRNTPKIVGGINPASTARARALYSQVCDTVVEAQGTREAEAAKLLENTYRHVNIALVNELARHFHELNIDVWDVIRLASTKPFGFQAFYPGPGVGGHCIPIDPNYLAAHVKERLGHPFDFIELAQQINETAPDYVAERTHRLLTEDGSDASGKKVLLIGVTYKPNIADERESPAVPLAEALQSRGIEVLFHDPFIEKWKTPFGEFDRVADLGAAVRDADAVVLVQNHADYDPDALAESATHFLDTRGVTTTAKAHRL